MERQLPKNVRQIGNVSDSSKIYVEDYVDTFFNQLCEKAEQEMVGAFLIGETVHKEEQDYIYVYGAIRMSELAMKGKDFVIEDSVWKNACETCKEYFGNAEILGWFIAGGEHPIEVNHNINKIHQKYFGREQSIFVTKNTRDKEEKFYIYKYKNMMECGGHYVYYEKNIEMQNYMIATRKRIGFTPSEIIEDRVTKNFRSLVREKAEKNEMRNHSRAVYAMSTFLILVVIVIGVTMINNYDKMRRVQNSLEEISQNVSEKDKDEAVETVGGNVTAKEDTDIEEQLTSPEIQEGTQSEVQSETQSDAQPEIQPDVPDGSTSDNTQSDEENAKGQETQEQTKPTKEYVVQKGDTLETISIKEYGDVLHVDAICKLNGLEDGNFIYIGQKLLLP